MDVIPFSDRAVFSRFIINAHTAFYESEIILSLYRVTTWRTLFFFYSTGTYRKIYDDNDEVNYVVQNESNTPDPAMYRRFGRRFLKNNLFIVLASFGHAISTPLLPR